MVDFCDTAFETLEIASQSDCLKQENFILTPLLSEDMFFIEKVRLFLLAKNVFNIKFILCEIKNKHKIKIRYKIYSCSSRGCGFV